MKQPVKILLILACLLILTGGVLAVVGIARDGFSWPRQDQGGPLEPKTYTFLAEEVSDLSLDDYESNVRLLPSTDGQVRVELMESKSNPYAVSLSGGLMSIKRDAPRFGHWFGWFFRVGSFTSSPPELLLYLPASFGEAEIVNTNGGISASGLSFSALAMETVNGSIVTSEVAVGGVLSAETTNGRVEIRQGTADRLLLSSTNGGVSVWDTAAQATLSANTVNGGISVQQSGAHAGTVRLSTVNGGIDFTGISGRDIEIETVSGRIKGIVRGQADEFIIEASTVTGKKEVPRSGNGPNRLTVSTVNGGIDVDIQP